MSGIFMSIGGPDLRISVNGEIHQFEMHPYCGPVLVDDAGEVLADQKPGHFFWKAVTHWAQQGHRMTPGGGDDDGIEHCEWNYPSEPITRHLGGRHYEVIGQTDPRPGN